MADSTPTQALQTQVSSDLQAAITKAVAAVPTPFQSLAASYIPAFYQMTQDEVVAIYNNLTKGDTEVAQAALRKKMTLEQLNAETSAINGLLSAADKNHQTATQFGKDFVATALSFALKALLAPVGL